MSELKCEMISAAAMARADGYESSLSLDEIQSHLAICANCRLEVEQLRAVMKLLDAQERRPRTEQVWSHIDERLREKQVTANRSFRRRPFLLMVLLLLGFKVIELVPRWDAGMLFKLLPVLIAAAIFSYIRENPFKINLELKPEGE
jgi:predicted anti-sigma-YlaC factor YlaD